MIATLTLPQEINQVSSVLKQRRITKPHDMDSEMYQEEIKMICEFIIETIKSFGPANPRRHSKDFQRVIEYGDKITIEDLKDLSLQSRSVSIPRNMAMYITRYIYPNVLLEAIGTFFGDRAKSTISINIASAQEYIDIDDDIRKLSNDVIQKLEDIC